MNKGNFEFKYVWRINGDHGWGISNQTFDRCTGEAAACFISNCNFDEDILIFGRDEIEHALDCLLLIRENRNIKSIGFTDTDGDKVEIARTDSDLEYHLYVRDDEETTVIDSNELDEIINAFAICYILAKE